MKKSRKFERSWPTTVIAGISALVALILAITTYRFEIAHILASMAFAGFFVLALIIAIQGKRMTLRELVDSWFYLP